MPSKEQFAALVHELVTRLMESPSLEPVDLQSIPESPGLYAAWLHDKQDCLYVSSAKSLRTQISDALTGDRHKNDLAIRIYDRYVHPLRSAQASTRAVNKLTREWMLDHVTFTCVHLERREHPRALSHAIRIMRPSLHHPHRPGRDT